MSISDKWVLTQSTSLQVPPQARILAATPSARSAGPENRCSTRTGWRCPGVGGSDTIPARAISAAAPSGFQGGGSAVLAVPLERLEVSLSRAGASEALVWSVESAARSLWPPGSASSVAVCATSVPVAELQDGGDPDSHHLQGLPPLPPFFPPLPPPLAPLFPPPFCLAFAARRSALQAAPASWQLPPCLRLSNAECPGWPHMLQECRPTSQRAFSTCLLQRPALKSPQRPTFCFLGGLEGSVLCGGGRLLPLSCGIPPAGSEAAPGWSRLAWTVPSLTAC